MAVAPLITLTATFDDLTGTEVGSVANPSKLIIVLAGFGQLLPRVVGTAMLAQITQVVLSTNGSFSTLLWANDQIFPPNTFYGITVIDGQGRPVQCGIYQFDAAGAATTIDLSNATQITQQPVLSPPAATQTDFLYSVLTVPTSRTFNIDFIPAASTIFQLFYNGNLLKRTGPNIDYTLAGQTVTTNFDFFEGENFYALGYVG